MATYTEKLIQAYAANRAREISADAAYLALCAQHTGDLQFDAERAQIEETKQVLENLLDQAITTGEQVERALNELRRWRRHRKLDHVYRLIMAAYVPKWSAVQQAYFEQAHPRMVAKYDFFLSFTTRHDPPTAPNVVNSLYQEFIRRVLGNAQYENSDLVKKNLLAETFYTLLSRSPVKGFIFTEHEHDNQVTEAKLRAACREAPVFLQIVQNAMLEEPDNRPNWCHFEYVEARTFLAGEGTHQQRMRFVVAESQASDLTAAALVPGRYEPWYQDFTARAPLYLEHGPQKATAIQDEVTKIWQWLKAIPEEIARRAPA